jgi:hypothetical protein
VRPQGEKEKGLEKAGRRASPQGEKAEEPRKSRGKSALPKEKKQKDLEKKGEREPPPGEKAEKPRKGGRTRNSPPREVARRKGTALEHAKKKGA